MRTVLPIVLLFPLSRLCSLVLARGANILLFVSDDHHYNSLGCFGNQLVQKLNLDPAEMRDLADYEEHAGLRKRLEHGLEAMRRIERAARPNIQPETSK